MEGKGEAPVDASRGAPLGQGTTPPLLRVGVSTRALLDLRPEHDLFVAEGAEPYGRLQRQRERDPARGGAAMGVVRRLLDLNVPGEPPLVEVVLLSRNPPDLSLRAFASAEAHGLAIKVGSFTGGRPLGSYVDAWKVDLFLSADGEDVAAAAAGGAAAATLARPPVAEARDDGRELRVAFDGDSVVFGPESDRVFEGEGLEAFVRNEAAWATTPLAAGPFAPVLAKLCVLRRACRKGDGRGVRVAVVTARGAPAHERVVMTLRAWGCEADEAHFVGGGDKSALLAAFGAHVFFDDREAYVRAAADLVPSGLVACPSPLVPTAVPAPTARRTASWPTSGGLR